MKSVILLTVFLILAEVIFALQQKRTDCREEWCQAATKWRIPIKGKTLCCRDTDEYMTLVTQYTSDGVKTKTACVCVY